MITSNHLQWAIDHRKPGTELRCLNDKYYLYSYTTVYDKEKKGAKKISGKLLVRITEQQGFIPSGKRKLEKELDLRNVTKLNCKEYGVSYLVTEKFSKYLGFLRNIFPDHLKSMIEVNNSFPPAKYRIKLYRVKYNSGMPELENKPAVASGSIAIHEKGLGSMPMVMYQYGAVFSKTYVPSFPDNSMETQIMIARFASKGYLVICADYFGKGLSDLPDSCLVKRFLWGFQIANHFKYEKKVKISPSRYSDRKTNHW